MLYDFIMKYFIKKLSCFRKFKLLIILIIFTSCSADMERISVGDRFSKPITQIEDNTHDKYTNSSSHRPISTEWIVDEGDTIEYISENTGVSIEDIAYYNSLTYPYSLESGMRLYIENRSDLNNLQTREELSFERDLVKSNGSYVVKEGDSLSIIASNFNTTVNQLVLLNDLPNKEYIYVGQELRIDGVKTQDNKTQGTVIQENNKNVNFVIEKDSSEVSNTQDPNFRWPLYGRVIKGFGDKYNNIISNGLIINGPQGADVSAAEYGVVTFVGEENYFGNIIVLKHSNDWVSSYAHLDSINVIVGQKINKGQIIGFVGKTGEVQSPQLYFEIRKGNEKVNPIDLLD